MAGKSDYYLTAFSNAEISALQEKYRNEVIERLGSTHEYQEVSSFFSARAEKERNQKWNVFLIYSQNVFERLAEYKAETPALPAIQSIVAEWQEIYLKTSIPVRMLC